MACKLPLTNGEFTLVDEECLPELSQFKWRKHRDGYVCFGERRRPGKYRLVLMHRIVNGTPDGLFTDHINGDKLDNRKCNLRNATHAQNTRNSRKYKSGVTSKFKGVSWAKDRSMWRVWIGVNRNIYIGQFSTEEEAAKAYDREAIERYGEFAQLNFPLTTRTRDL